MKSKISKIIGVAVTLSMLISMIVMPGVASASTLSWGAERGPSTTDVNLAPDGVEIVEMAQRVIPLSLLLPVRVTRHTSRPMVVGAGPS
jgi:hypothetical protein